MKKGIYVGTKKLGTIFKKLGKPLHFLNQYIYQIKSIPQKRRIILL